MRLFSYKMTHDTGFSPNPFYDYLTLATCKPGIRRTKKVGDWIAGFSSKYLKEKSKENGVSIDQSALIYLGKISEILTIQDYFNDKRFNKKIPPPDITTDLVMCVGDNIYEPVCPYPEKQFHFKQISFIHHGADAKEDDLSGKNVLIFKEYYYLGRSGTPVPPAIKISIPNGPSNYGYRTNNVDEISVFLEWVRGQFTTGVNANPCLWDECSNEKESRGSYEDCI